MSLYTENIAQILRDIAREEIQSIRQYLQNYFRNMHYARGNGEKVNWDQFESDMTGELDRKSHETHQKALEKMKDSADQIPSNHRDSFWQEAMKGVEQFSNFINEVTSGLTQMITDCFETINDVVNEAVGGAVRTFEKVGECLNNTTHAIGNQIDSTIDTIEDWSPF